ncbi:MAG: LpxL/LpxP family Kdo(2)-lipid IV(A) lauroyl/palmitoleoyl acyltransferase [Gammaproteobacteria bacterium]|nr:LpxL/LpxP family Kdo(2)-lipid IV(A) lauroyl/palmitoleoyl acyltransferase [Gammaproteobacteria bacterium]
MRFLAPRFWPTWLLLGIMWLIAQLPYRAQLATGNMLGRMMYYASPPRRHIAAVNLRLCFPELSEPERATLLRRHFASLGMSAVETAMSWWTPDKKLRRLAHIEGLEHLEQAGKMGRGVILLSGHFTTLEIGARLLVMQVLFHAMYREHKNPLFEAVMRRARERHCEYAIPRGDVRALLNSLKMGLPVWYAPDQNYSSKNTVFVPFFGVPASTTTATSRLARMSGAAVVPFFQHRLPGTQGYALTLLPALAGFPSEDVEADTLRINQLIEAQIRKAPEQYLWVHRRFKTRPEGVRDVYTT